MCPPEVTLTHPPDASPGRVKVEHLAAMHPEDEVLGPRHPRDETPQLQSASEIVELT